MYYIKRDSPNFYYGGQPHGCKWVKTLEEAEKYPSRATAQDVFDVVYPGNLGCNLRICKVAEDNPPDPYDAYERAMRGI